MFYLLYLVAPNSLEFLFLRGGDMDTKASAPKITMAGEGHRQCTRPVCLLDLPPRCPPKTPARGATQAQPSGTSAPIRSPSLVPPTLPGCLSATGQTNTVLAQGLCHQPCPKLPSHPGSSFCLGHTHLHPGSLEAPDLFLQHVHCRPKLGRGSQIS